MTTSLPQPKSPGLLGVWEHFTLEDGLPDLKIECLFVDSRDQLWVGTHDRGVARFDGDKFETFTTRDGLAGDGVFSIIEDREGALWFGTFGGLSRYDGKEFETIRPRSGEQCGFIWGRCMDREGRLWFGVKDQPGHATAVCRWDGQELAFIPLADPVEGLNTIHQIAASANGEIWFGGTGLYRCAGEQFHCLVAPSSRQCVCSMLLRSSGELWYIGSDGLTIYDSGQFNRLGQEVAGYRVSGLLEDPTGAVWLTSWQKALLRYKGGSFQVVQKSNNPLLRNPCLDRQGRLWVLTYGWGLYCYDTTRFEIFQKEQGLPADDVNCLAESAEGGLWVGTSAGMVGYDGKEFHPLAQAENLQGKGIFALQVDAVERLWIAAEIGLYVHEEGALRLG